jgi:putative membrane protein
LPEREPIDLRILQANERTLLAWVRTGLALMAFGFVLARITVFVGPDAAHADDVWLSTRAGIAFIALGTACHPIAAIRFVRARRAILDRREVVPGGAAAVALAAGAALLGVLLAGYLVIW